MVPLRQLLDGALGEMPHPTGGHACHTVTEQSGLGPSVVRTGLATAPHPTAASSTDSLSLKNKPRQLFPFSSRHLEAHSSHPGPSLAGLRPCSPDSSQGHPWDSSSELVWPRAESPEKRGPAGQPVPGSHLALHCFK